RMEELSGRLSDLARLVRREDLDASLPEVEPPPEQGDADGALVAEVDILANPSWAADRRGSKEYQMRSRNAQMVQAAAPAPATPIAARPVEVRPGPFRAVWIGPALILARRVSVEDGTY